MRSTYTPTRLKGVREDCSVHTAHVYLCKQEVGCLVTSVQRSLELKKGISSFGANKLVKSIQCSFIYIVLVTIETVLWRCKRPEPDPRAGMQNWSQWPKLQHLHFLFFLIFFVYPIISTQQQLNQADKNMTQMIQSGIHQPRLLHQCVC